MGVIFVAMGRQQQTPPLHTTYVNQTATGKLATSRVAATPRSPGYGNRPHDPPCAWYTCR